MKWILLGSVAALLFLSAFVSPVWYDDAGHFLVSRELADHQSLCYPVHLDKGICDSNSQFITVGPALSIPAGLWMGIFGTTMISVRIFMVLLSICFLFVFKGLAPGLFDRFQDEKGMVSVLLIAGNIQFLTYGAEFLGEVPMLLALFAGFNLLLKSMKQTEGPLLSLAAGLCFLSAILVKEYILLPLGATFTLWMLFHLFMRQWTEFFNAFLILLVMVAGILGWHYYKSGSVESMMDFLKERNSYGSEFFAFEPSEALRFILFKPLVTLGTLALLLKLYFRRDKVDFFFAIFHFVQLALFLVSAGYDRFGFQLLFIPALYFSEFVVLIIERLKNKVAILKVGFALLFLVLFTQKSFPTLLNRALGNENNLNERRVNEILTERKQFQIFTYDQQLIPFLRDEIRFRLSPEVPSAAESCLPLQLLPGEYFVAGPYAFSEFPACVNWEKLQLLDSTSDGVYKIFRAKDE